MKYRILDPQVMPPGGWQYRQIETQWESPKPKENDFKSTVRLIALHRHQNPAFGLSTNPSDIEDDLTQFTALRIKGDPNYVEPIDEEAKKKTNSSGLFQRLHEAAQLVVDRLKRDTRTAQVLMEWFGDGATPVAQDIAQTRADTCILCPFNVPAEQIEASVVAAVTSRMRVKGQISVRVQGEDRLRTCKICKCDLKTKIWVPYKHLDKIGQPDNLPPTCWIDKERDEYAQRSEEQEEVKVALNPNVKIATSRRLMPYEVAMLGARNITTPVEDKHPNQPIKTANNAIPIRARLDNYTGYGTYSSNLVSSLLNKGTPIALYPIYMELQGSENKWPDVITNSVQRSGHNTFEWELFLYTLVLRPEDVSPGERNVSKRTVFFTMWESTRVPIYNLKLINSCALVIVPNQWCASCLSAQGIEIPIAIVPLGIEVSKFPFTPRRKRKEFVFGAAGRLTSGGIRKGVGLIIEAFKSEFPNDPDVRLRIKAGHNCPIPNINDDRITVNQSHFNTEQLADWYKDIDVLVSASACEGWGLHQQESMCIGRPVIGVNFGGITEFWNPTNGYAVDYRMVEGKGPYENCGRYAEMDMASLGRTMRRAMNDPDFETKSRLGSADASKFDISNSAAKLLLVLKEYGFIA